MPSNKNPRSTRRPHDSRESDPEAGEGARGRVADGVSDNSSFVKASYFSVLRRLSPAILGGIGRYAGWLCRERPRGTMRASRIAVLSLIGLLLIGAAAVLLLRMPKPATVTDGIAARYPGDVGIETDPEVFFVERFDEGTIASLAARYEDVLNQGDLSFVADVPPGSAASSSLLMTAVGGVRPGAHLFKNLAADGRAQDDTLYLRYYVKYRSPFTPHHNGVWMGGANPPVDWPNPQAGTRPAGGDPFLVPTGTVTSTMRLDNYVYRKDIPGDPNGQHLGNEFLQGAGPRGPPDTR